jgi:hypothetical protein
VGNHHIHFGNKTTAVFSMLGGGIPTCSDCVCSTSYKCVAPRPRLHCPNALRHRNDTCLHESSCWGSSPSAKFKSRQIRRTVARSGLKIEARRTRPDPIIAPYIVREQGGQEASKLPFVSAFLLLESLSLYFLN